MAVVAAIGIDLGTSSAVIAACRKGGVDILDNEVSNRLTPAYVGFGDKDRAIGERGLGEFARAPNNTCTNVNRLLGRKFNESEIEEIEKGFITCKLTEGENGDILANVRFAGEARQFQPEALVAMMMVQLGDIVELGVGAPIKDVVICCPGYYTMFQRAGILDAGKIAGLNIVALYNEHAALALQYGISKPQELSPTDARNVMIVDWGYANLSVSVATFLKGKGEVLGTAFERHCGGRDLDKIIVDHFMQEFNAQHKVDLRDKPKSMVKLAAQCEKVKRTLSANVLANINMECLYDDFDLNSKMERDTLAELAAPIYAKILPVVQKALDNSGLTKDDLFAVEVTGNSRPIPSFQEAITGWFGKKCSTTFDASGGLARGAALTAAMLSPAFKVREFKIVDKSPYAVTLIWQPYNATKEQADAAAADPVNVYDVFKPFNVVPSTKMLTFDKVEPFQLVAYYKTPEDLPPGTGVMLGVWKCPTIPPAKEGATPLTSRQIKVKAKLNIHSILEVDAPQVWDTYEPEPDEPPAAEAEPEAAAEAEAEPEAAGEAEPESSTEAEPEAKPEEAKAEPEIKKPKKAKVVKSEISMTPESMLGLTAERVTMLIDDEKKMHESDVLAKKTAQAMNDLETYIYKVRDSLDYAWNDFVEEGPKAEFSALLGTMENWLYDEGFDAALELYVSKLDELKKFGDEIEFRVKESENRSAVITAARDKIASIQADASSGPEIEKYSHIEQADKDKVLAECQRVSAWLDGKLSELDSTPKNVKPTVTCGEIENNIKELDKFQKPLMDKPKPKPKPPEKKEEAPAAEPEGEAGAEPEGEAEPETAAPMDTEEKPETQA